MHIAVKIFLIILACIAGIPILYQIVVRIIRKLVVFPAPAFIGRFLDSDHRRRIQRPDKIIERSGIKEGMDVLEIGCGSGAFTTFVSRAVGNKGKVSALDIQQDMLDQLQRKLERPGNADIKNIQLIRASAYKLPFKKDSLDLVYMVSVFQEIPDKKRTLKEIKRILKPGGTLAISEFLVDPDYPFRTTTIWQGREGGFRIDSVEGNFFNYTVRFTK
jgi:ubiquinone/menaquinone biosynthesis C-methylase UbiE